MPSSSTGSAKNPFEPIRFPSPEQPQQSSSWTRHWVKTSVDPPPPYSSGSMKVVMPTSAAFRQISQGISMSASSTSRDDWADLALGELVADVADLPLLGVSSTSASAVCTRGFSQPGRGRARRSARSTILRSWPATRSRVAVVGDYQPANETHTATDAALGHVGVEFDWLGTDSVDPEEAASAYDALWIAPSSPYRNMEAALEVIRLARERGVPLVGT